MTYYGWYEGPFIHKLYFPKLIYSVCLACELLDFSLEAFLTYALILQYAVKICIVLVPR